MEWLFEKFPAAIVLFVIYAIAAAVKNARDKKAEHESTHDETAEQRRVREIQERIRRIAAERRGGRVPADQPAPRRIETLPPAHETIGGPLKRMFDELEGRMQPVPEPPRIAAPVNRAEVERQEDLADQLRALEEAKTVALRRAAHLRDATEAHANLLAQRRGVARTRLLEDLHDRESLRRAFLLREVLGPPVGMR